MDDRHPAPPVEHVGGSRIGPLGPQPVASPPPDRRRCIAVAHAGHGVRARQALLSGAALLTGGDDRRDDASARPLRAQPGMGDAPAASTRTDRWGGPRGGCLPGSLHMALSGQRPRRRSARLYSALCPYRPPTSCSPTASPWSPAVARASVVASPRD